MPDILPTEIVTLLVGMISIGAADLIYHHRTINQRLHSLWVSVSITVMCLPILDWAAIVFVGAGRLSHSLIGIFEVAIFLWLYRNLRKLPAVRKLGHGLPPSPPAAEPNPPTGPRRLEWFARDPGSGDPLSGNQNHWRERAAGGADRSD
jgi:hypothetical protein